MRSFITTIILGISLIACNQAAKNSEEAAELLQNVPIWHIDRITVNDKIVMKDGQSIPSFDGIQFDRYMSTIGFNADGSVQGVFNKGSKQTNLVWAKADGHIAISAAEGSHAGAGWQIPFSTSFPDSFAMSTSTTAYDFPRTTKIVLFYKHVKDQ